MCWNRLRKRFINAQLRKQDAKIFMSSWPAPVTSMGRGAYPRILDGSALSSTVRNIMLKHAHISPEKSSGKKNIQIPAVGKQYYPPSRSLLERVRKEHTHINPTGQVIGKIIRKREGKKPRLNRNHEKKRCEFAKWVLEELNKRAIFICSDEKYHGIENASRPQNVTVPEEVPAEVAAVFKAKAQFTFMQFGSHSIEEEVIMGPIHL